MRTGIEKIINKRRQGILIKQSSRETIYKMNSSHQYIKDTLSDNFVLHDMPVLSYGDAQPRGTAFRFSKYICCSLKLFAMATECKQYDNVEASASGIHITGTL